MKPSDIVQLVLADVQISAAQANKINEFLTISKEKARSNQRITRKSWTKEDRQVVRDMVNRCCHENAIAAKLGCTRSSVLAQIYRELSTEDYATWRSATKS